MIKNILLGIATLLIISCGSTDTQLKTPSGYAYTHTKMGTEKIKEGDFVSFSMTVEGSDGTILQEMKEGPGMPVMQIPTADMPAQKQNPVIEALATASVNDTINLVMPMDSMPGAETNPALKGMEYIRYVVVVKSTKDEQTYKAEIEAERLEMEAEAEVYKNSRPEIVALVDKTLADYKKGKLDLKTTDSGLKYYIHKEGEGEYAAAGTTSSVHYYGVTMDGNSFDDSYKTGNPYPVAVGQRRVIAGWDEALPLLKEGTQASLFIPYQLAYGEAGNPPRIGPKSELMFYVEISKVN